MNSVAHLSSSPADTHATERKIPIPIKATIKQSLFLSIEEELILSDPVHLLICGRRMKEVTFPSRVTEYTPIGGSVWQEDYDMELLILISATPILPPTYTEFT